MSCDCPLAAARCLRLIVSNLMQFGCSESGMLAQPRNASTSLPVLARLSRHQGHWEQTSMQPRLCVALFKQVSPFENHWITFPNKSSIKQFAIGGFCAHKNWGPFLASSAKRIDLRRLPPEAVEDPKLWACFQPSIVESVIVLHSILLPLACRSFKVHVSLQSSCEYLPM